MAAAVKSMQTTHSSWYEYRTRVSRVKADCVAAVLHQHVAGGETKGGANELLSQLMEALPSQQ